MNGTSCSCLLLAVLEELAKCFESAVHQLREMSLIFASTPPSLPFLEKRFESAVS
jgi:hypothetical protein